MIQVPSAGLCFLPHRMAAALQKHPKRQEVETASFLKPGPSTWYNVTSAIVYCSRDHTAQVQRGDSDPLDDRKVKGSEGCDLKIQEQLIKEKIGTVDYIKILNLCMTKITMQTIVTE